MTLPADVSLRLVDTFADACDLMSWLGERRPVLGVDTETGGLDFWRFDLRLVQVGDANAGWAIPWDRWSGLALEALTRYEGRTVYHNAKFDVHFLEYHGDIELPWQNIDDTRLMAHLVDPVSQTGLKSLAARFIDPKAVTGQLLLSDAMAKQGWNWGNVPVKFMPYWTYAALDTVLTARIWEHFEPQITARYRSVYELELAVEEACMGMERRGIRIDVPTTEQQFDNAQSWIANAKDWVDCTYGVKATSNPQVADALIANGVQLTQRTDTGRWKLDADVLESIDHPLASTVLTIRKTEKIANTYFKNFLEIHEHGYLHPSINTLGARTGRMSVDRPALQTLPRGPVVRDCFIPRAGRAFVLADFDQIELRLLAHFARETTMIEAIRSGQDLHTYTAQLAYADPTIDRKDPRRQLAKNAGFAKIYGAGTAKFAQTAGVDFDVAQEFLDRYDYTYPRVRAFQREVEAVAIQRQATEGDAYVLSPIGRRHPAESDSYYKLVNYLIQGTAADVLKMKIVEIGLKGLGDYMLLPVHDEMVFDVPLADVDEVAVTVKEVMEEHQLFEVPLTVGVDIVTRWGDKYR